jgi:hypothetical protein
MSIHRYRYLRLEVPWENRYYSITQKRKYWIWSLCNKGRREEKWLQMYCCGKTIQKFVMYLCCFLFYFIFKTKIDWNKCKLNMGVLSFLRKGKIYWNRILILGSSGYICLISLQVL